MFFVYDRGIVASIHEELINCIPDRVTMIAKTYLLTLVFFCTGVLNSFSQTFNLPAIGLKSHQTLEVLRVDATPDKTVIHLSVENRINDGTFCADKNIFIVYPDGSEVKLERASGIPQCPDNHKFKSVGEKLSFTLAFPSLKQGTGWIDLVEECNENCFSIYGLLLNNELSEKIDEAVNHIEKGQIDSAIGLYEKLIENTETSGSGISGSLYSDLISLLVSKGYTASASMWYKKLISSDIPRKQLYIDNLNFRGIKF